MSALITNVNIRKFGEIGFKGYWLKLLLGELCWVSYTENQISSPFFVKAIVWFFRITLEKLNKHTLVFDDEANERVIYVFDYSNIYLNRLVLKHLKDKNKWNVIKHPFVFNYINETLLNSAFTYTMHIVLYFAFLLILYSYIHAKPTIWNNSLVTVFVIIFIFFLVRAFTDPFRDFSITSPFSSSKPNSSLKGIASVYGSVFPTFSLSSRIWLLSHSFGFRCSLVTIPGTWKLRYGR